VGAVDGEEQAPNPVAASTAVTAMRDDTTLRFLIMEKLL